MATSAPPSLAAPSRLPWGLVALLPLVIIIGLSLEGQAWWCAEGDGALWISDIWSSHNSQHVADPYSLSHFAHGLIFAMLLMLPRLRRLAPGWRCLITGTIEVAWELFENTDFIINRYRDSTLALGYTGDTIANSLGDLAFCLAGFFVASRLGWRWSLAIFVLLELVMLFWIRDNLTLNVLMLLYPIPAIKHWQMP